MTTATTRKTIKRKRGSITDSLGRQFVIYNNNPQLKGVNSPVPFTKEEASEYAKCMADPIYFAKNYVHIVNVDRGVIKFEMWDFQEKMVRTYARNRYAITLCPRQVGKSTTVVSYMLWLILFHPQKNCCILAHKGETARELLARLREAYELLPLWMQQGVKTWNKGFIELENGSKVRAAATTSGSIRGQSYNLVFLDEFAFVPNNMAEEFFASVYPTIASGKTTQVIIVSTPNGMNHFYRMWTDANKKEGEKGKNAYAPVRVHWQEVPGRDEAWKKQTIANTSERQFAQEQECEFLGSAGTLLSISALRSLAYTQPIHSKDGLDIFEMPEDGHSYVITADCGKGVGMDYSAFQVVDVTELPYRQVAKYRDNQISHLIYPNVIKRVADMYHKAWVLVELNDVGQSVADILYQDLEHEELFMVEINQNRGGQQLSSGVGGKMVRYGLQQSVASKNLGCANLKSMIEDHKLIIRDFDTISELSTFVQDGKTFAAEEGMNDDLVMSLVLFGWLANQQLFKDMTDMNMRDKMFQEKTKAIEEDMLPIFVDRGTSSYEKPDVYVDSKGRMWRIADDSAY